MRFRLLFLFTVICSLFAQSPQALAQSPNAVITVMSTSGEVPFTVHVHGLASTIGVGTAESALFEWDFGEPFSQFNLLQGWNAAHTYDTPGTKTIILHVTNQTGEASRTSVQVTANSSTRTVYFVSHTGNDNNDGLSEATPIKTLAKVQTLMGNNKEFRFDANGVYTANDTLAINNTNVVLSTYGWGNIQPVLYWPYTNILYGSIININSASQRVTIQDLGFDSADTTPNTDSPQGMNVHGGQVTVRRCHFNKVYYAMDAASFDAGLLTQSNSTSVIGGYFCWMGGTDNVHIGNTVADSTAQHNLRGADLLRVLIAHNDLQCPTSGKSAIWLMFGDYAYVTDNVSHGSRMLCGPNNNDANSNPAERMRHAVFESNLIEDQAFIAYAGAEDVWYKNNISTFSGGVMFSCDGYIAQFNRRTKNIRLYNNTYHNFSNEWGRFVDSGVGAESMFVANNLHHAPYLNPAAQGVATNCEIDDPNLNLDTYNTDLWALPVSGGNVHKVGGSFKTVAQWDAYAQTTGELYRQFQPGDLDATFTPTFNANVGVAVAGVHRDFYGNFRPLTGTVTVGAVQD